MRTYQQVSQMLSAGQIKALYVLERGSVEFELDNGWTILLGSEDLPDRLAARCQYRPTKRDECWRSGFELMLGTQMVSRSIAHFLP